MAIRVAVSPNNGNKSPRSMTAAAAMGPSSTLFPNTNNTSGYRPTNTLITSSPVSSSYTNHPSSSVALTTTSNPTASPISSPRNGGGGDVNTEAISSYSALGRSVGGYRPTHSTSASSPSTALVTNGGGGVGNTSPRSAAVPSSLSNSIMNFGPRVGASLTMKKVDLVVDPNAAQTIATIKEAAALAAAGGNNNFAMSNPIPTSSASLSSSYGNPKASSAVSAGVVGSSSGGGQSTTNSHNAVNLQNGIHIIIPAPPPSWSGGGAPSSVIQRSFLAAGASNSNQHGGNTTAMVTVTESPYYTHQSLKDAQKQRELELSETTMKQIRKNTNPDGGDNANKTKAALLASMNDGVYRAKGAIQSSIPPNGTARSRTNAAAKSVVIIPLNAEDMNEGGGVIEGGGVHSTEATNDRATTASSTRHQPLSPTAADKQTSPSKGAAALAPVGTTTIHPLSPAKRNVAPIVNVQGYDVSCENRKNVCGVAIVEVSGDDVSGGGSGGDNGANGGGATSSLVEQRAGITLSTTAEERYRSEILVAEAVRQAEASAHIFADPSYNLGSPNRKPRSTSPSKSKSTSPHRQNNNNNNNTNNTSHQNTTTTGGEAGAVPSLPSFFTPNAITVGVDSGRDRTMASSIRVGHHSDALQKAAVQSQQRVGFAVEMAPTLGAAATMHSNATNNSSNKPALIPTPPQLNAQQLQQRGALLSSAGQQPQHAAANVVGNAFGHHHTKVAGYGEAHTAPSSPVAFGIATPRFGHDSDDEKGGSGKKSEKKKKKERAPPVGHYNIKYSRTETIATRDIYFAGHGIPYDKLKNGNHATHHNNSSHHNSPRHDHVSPPPAPADAPSSPATEKKKKLSARERARIRLEEEEEQRIKEGGHEKKSSAFMSTLPRLQTSPRRDAEILHASAIGSTPYGEFNEEALSKSPRTRCAVDMGKSGGGGRDERSGWDRRPEVFPQPPIRETHYTGLIFGDKRDASAFPRGYTDMYRQSGRGVPIHSHQGVQQATGGSQLVPGQPAPLNTLDLQDMPAGNVNATSKFKNTAGTATGAVNAIGKTSPRTFHVKPANNVSSDARPDVLGVHYAGSSAMKGPKSPVAFTKQTARPENNYKSACAVESYDTEFVQPDGTIVSSLQAKNDTTSPRTRQADFNRMGSHNDYNSYAKAAERSKQHDADVGIGEAAMHSGFVHTRPRTLKNVDFAQLAPRKEDKRRFVESCADPANIYPEQILYHRVGGDPFLSAHTSREAAKKAKSLKSNRSTDAFYDIPPHVGYSGERCKSPRNAVDISTNTGRDAYGHHRNTTAPHLSQPSSSSPLSSSRNNKTNTGERPRQVSATANLGPGQYDYNVKVLSKPLPAVAFGKEVDLAKEE